MTMTGKHHTPEYVREMSETRKGIPWNEKRRLAQKLKCNRKPKSTKVGGKEYHPLWSEIRKLVYKRDNWICQECGVHCHNGIKINAHHIDYDIMNNDLSNLITLCTACHMKTNYRRDGWIIYYSKKMKGE